MIWVNRLAQVQGPPAPIASYIWKVTWAEHDRRKRWHKTISAMYGKSQLCRLIGNTL